MVKQAPTDYGPHLMTVLRADYLKLKDKVKVVRTWPDRDWRTPNYQVIQQWSVTENKYVTKYLKSEFPPKNLLSVLTSAEMVYVALKRNY